MMDIDMDVSTDRMISLVVFGGLGALLGCGLIWSTAWLLRNWLRSRKLLRARGTVIAHQDYAAQMSSATGGYTTHVLKRPVVQFIAHDGRSYQCVAGVASNVPPPVGSPVLVAFPPRNPAAAEVDSLLARYFAPAVVTFGLLVFFLVIAGVGWSVLR